MHENSRLRKRTLWITGIIVILFSAVESYGQASVVSGHLSSGNMLPNEIFILEMSIDEPSDLYYFGMEVEYDSESIEFVSLENVGLTGGGINTGGTISHNRIGVAVSRTDNAAVSGSGAFMELTFSVKPLAETGISEFVFIEPELIDSHGNLIETEGPASVEITVDEGIGFAELTIPEFNQVIEGEPYTVGGKLYASGVTSDVENADRIRAWIGVSMHESHPEEWEESSWQEMELLGETNNMYEYTGEAALLRQPGTYSIALRFQLDVQELIYAGVGGFWDPVDHPAAVVEILQSPSYRFTIAHWDFSDLQLIPSFSIPDNDFAEVEIYGSSFTSVEPLGTQTAGGITYLNTRNWHVAADDPDGEKYIQIVFSTSQLENIQLSSSHSGTNTGPRNFIVQLSSDGVLWEDLYGSEIDLANGVVHIQNLPLPALYNDSESVWVRWLRIGDSRIDESDNGISTQGTHRIGNITISGTNINPQRIEVLPGDTNNDGVVNSIDVLALGTYWQSRGPGAIYDFLSFEPREVEVWIPEAATFADTNGDGVVDQKDLLPIGLNFGKVTSTQLKSADTGGEPLAILGLEPMLAGNEVEILIKGLKKELLSGLSYRLTLDGVSPDSWNIVSKGAMEWSRKWADENRLIEFSQKRSHSFEEAVIHKGRNTGLEVQEMVLIRIKAEQNWNNGAFLTLDWLAISRPDGKIEKLSSAEIVAESSIPEEKDPDIPNITMLHQNYPNPFNPATVISYQLSSESHVRLDVYNILGQHVASLVESQQQPGIYSINFNAGNLASGLYLYRLQTGERVYNRRMMLVK